MAYATRAATLSLLPLCPRAAQPLAPFEERSVDVKGAGEDRRPVVGYTEEETARGWDFSFLRSDLHNGRRLAIVALWWNRRPRLPIAELHPGPAQPWPAKAPPVRSLAARVRVQRALCTSSARQVFAAPTRAATIAAARARAHLSRPDCATREAHRLISAKSELGNYRRRRR